MPQPPRARRGRIGEHVHLVAERSEAGPHVRGAGLGRGGHERDVKRFACRLEHVEDAQLLSGVEAAGGRIYRTHGLGYILRRTGAGHTWQRDDEEFRRPDIVASEWPGFQPSLALEVDPLDRPGTHGGEQ